MRPIHISNEKKRDAEVTFDTQVKKKNVRMILKNGEEKINVKILKSTVATDPQFLVDSSDDLKYFAETLINEDPEADMENAGRKLDRTHKLYVDRNNNIAYRLNLFRVIYNPDGTEKERRDVNKLPSNVNAKAPLRWTGKKFPKEKAIRQFVFTRKYQVRHINGVTFDFLYNMAKELDESNSLLLIGGGEKGNEPVLLTRGGQPYRGFLEGRIKEDRYSLILHLTDIELKGLDNATE